MYCSGSEKRCSANQKANKVSKSEGTRTVLNRYIISVLMRFAKNYQK